MTRDRRTAARKSERVRLKPHFRGEKFTGPLGVLIASLAGGAMFMASFAPFSMWPLLPLSLGCLIFASFTRHWLGAAFGGFLWGLAAFIPLFSWANIYAGVGPWLALAGFEALFIVIFALIARIILVRRGIRLTTSLSIACVWAIVEYGRANYPWGGLSWGISAFAYENSPLLNFGPWIGVVGLAVVSGFLGAYCFSVAMSLLLRRRKGRNGVSFVWPAAVIMAVLVSALVIPRPQSTVPADGHSLRVAAIQGNVEKPEAGSYYLPETMFAHHAQETERLAESGESARLVVWPEDSTGWDVTSEHSRMDILQTLSDRLGAPLLVATQVPHGNNQRLNKSLLIDSQGVTGQEYAKRHPVPFGEYIPARDVFSKITNKVALVSTDMAAGTKVGVMNVDHAKVGVLICFEIAYDNSVRDTVLGGAEVLVVQSNNALFLDSYEAIQQRSQARVFAVISGRSVVHVSTVGYSAIYTPEGRTLGSLGHWENGTMVADVPLRSHTTPALAYFSLILGLTVALALLGTCHALLSPARTTKEDA